MAKSEELSSTSIECVDTTTLQQDIRKSEMLTNMSKNRKLLLCALGIFVCYFYFGILQEKITRGDYGEGKSKEKYQCTMALVFVQCVVNSIYAKIILMITQPAGRDTTKNLYYASSAFTYLTAMVTSNMALKHINYPTQVVGKSCKPIPVMLLGVLIGHKRYSLQKYLFVLMIVLGVILFMYKDKQSVTSDSESILGMGEILLLLSLTMDGLTGAFQDRMKTEHQTKSGPMMLNMNLWSVLFLGIGLLSTGEAIEFVKFVQRHPSIIFHLATFSIASALGQFFIFLTVSEFGPLTCSIITTTRKFFTVLGSVVIFGNKLMTRQWLGTTLVFTGLSLDGVYGNRSSTSASTHVKKESEKSIAATDDK